jgi:hypothetical protein
MNPPDTIDLSKVRARLTEASRDQLDGWLEDLTEAYAPYISARPWWMMPTDCAVYAAGEKLARLIGLVAAELAFRGERAGRQGRGGSGAFEHPARRRQGATAVIPLDAAEHTTLRCRPARSWRTV